MSFSRRRFLDAATLLALAGPLGGRLALAKSSSGAQDAVATALAIRNKQTTALEQVDLAIQRLERANPKINAVAFPNYARARDRARCGVTGSLAGVPTLIKDNVAQKGLANTRGARIFRDQIAENDAPVVHAIEQAGLISIGRSTLPELAESVSTESLLTGATRNPWNLDYTVGGSSGGSAAAVAAGVVAVAHANDRAGSVRHAAAPCGLVGLKPSRGRVIGEEKAHMVNDPLVQGVVSRTVRDTAAWLAATETHVSGALHAPIGWISDATMHRLKIGLCPRRPSTGQLPAPVVQDVLMKSAELLRRLGHEVRDQPLAFDGPAAGIALVELWEASISRLLPAIEQQLGRPLAKDDLEPRRFQMAERGRRYSEDQLRAAAGALGDAVSRYLAQFDSLDIYMTPVFATEPVKLGVFDPMGAWDDQRERLMEYACYCWIDNSAGTPAITLPLGWSPDGLPIGVQFAARPGGERVLIELAYQLERELRWADRRPPIWFES
jgi:amidase